MKLLVVCLMVSMRLAIAFPTNDDHNDEVDGETSRKIIGQSVVTSVSVIMNGDGEAPQFTDAVGKTVPRPFVPPQVASPINLLNPDRYEFYTFNDSGELVKRLMTLKEIQSIVANGNGAMIGDNEPESQSVILNTIPLSNQGAETKVQDIVDNVQHVLSREMENNKNASQIPSQLLDTPDVSSSWSMILPAIFGNTGEILPHKPINMTPETEILDTTTTKVRKTTTKVPTKTVPSTKAPPRTTQTSTTKVQSTVVSTKKQTVRVKPKPTISIRSTTEEPTEAASETQTEAVAVSPTKEQNVKTKPRPTVPHKSTTEQPTEAASESSETQTEVVTLAPTKKQTTKLKPKPTSPYRSTTERTTEAVKQTTTEVAKEITTEEVATRSTETPTTTLISTTEIPTSVASTTKEATREVPVETKKETFKVKPRPTSYRSTTEPPTEAFAETIIQEVTKIISRPSTSKVTPTKKIVKKPTVATYKRPLTNSPIIIEKIPKKPMKTASSTSQTKSEHVTQKTMTTVEMKAEPSIKYSVSVAPSTSETKETQVMTKTEAPTTTTTHQTSTEKPKIPSTTRKPVSEATQMMTMEPTTLTTSEEDRQDFAINQIIGSLQSDLFTNYERITTFSQPDSEPAANELAMEKTGDLNLLPDKVLMNDQLFIDEAEPIVKDIPSTTTLPDEPSTTHPPPIFEKLEATTSNSKLQEIPLENSEIMQTIEQLIKEQADGKTKTKEKLDVLGFDDDDETEIRLKDTLESKKNLTQSEFIIKAATVASILSTKFSEEQPTTAAPLEESDTTVSTILSEALANVIQLMKSEMESKKTTEKPLETFEALPELKPSNVTSHEQKLNNTTGNFDEPSELELNKLLLHYEDLNSQDQFTALSMLSEKASSQQPEAETSTALPFDDKTTLFETTVVKETSSVSIKTGDNDEKRTTAMESDGQVSTTEAASEEFSTFFFIDNDGEETTSDPLNDGLGDFTTEQFVNTEKQMMDRKDEFSTTQSSEEELRIESDEEPGDIFADVLNVIGIANDEEDDERLKSAPDSQESDEVESAISSLTSTIDGTLATDVKTDFTLTSKIASSLISVADTLSDTLNDEDESEEEVTTFIATTEVPIVKDESTTDGISTAESIQKTTETVSTEKVEEVSTTIKQAIVETTEKQEVTETEKLMEATEASMESATNEQMVLEMKTEKESDSPMVPLSIVRKDNSLEEIDFITPSTPTSTRIPTTEGNFVRIESIETTAIPKVSVLKTKGQEVHEHVKPIYIALRSTTTSPPETPSTKPTVSVEQTSKMEETIFTERVPLIEITKPSVVPVGLSSTEDNLVEIKVQRKPTVAVTSTTEQTQSTLSQIRPNAQTIKNTIKNAQQHVRLPSVPIDLSSTPGEALGLAASTAGLNSDLSSFSKLCNELAFSFWKSITADGISQSRSVVISPFALTSFLSMIFLGARGQTSGEMNDLLRLDDMVSFNPHVVFRNISESIEQTKTSGVSAAAFVRELYSDRSKGKLLPYFKEKAQQYYGAHVEEVNFNVINDILRRRTNLLVKRHTFSKINEYLKTNNIWVSEPLAAVSANVFLTDCSGTTNSERDGEMFFQVSPAIRQRRLIPIPAAVYRSGFTAGYDPIIDATAVAFGDDLQSTIMVMPGQQGSLIPGDNLERLESAFMDPSNDAWGRLLTTFMERPGLEVQIPRFSHRSLINTTFALQQMGLKDIFDANKADLRGLTGAKSNDLYFSDLMQINQFSTCGEDKIGDSHHIEIYPSPSLKREFNDGEEEDGKLEIASSAGHSNMQYKSLFYDPIYDSRYMNVPLPLRPRQARLPENPRLRFDRPFLYFVRHNPTGIILFMGRFNPRLLP